MDWCSKRKRHARVLTPELEQMVMATITSLAKAARKRKNGGVSPRTCAGVCGREEPDPGYEPDGASFTSPAQLRQAIGDLVTVYNEKAAPFEWKKAVVFPSAPKSKYSD